MIQVLRHRPWLSGGLILLLVLAIGFYLWRQGIFDYWVRKRATKKLFKKYRDQKRRREQFHEKYRG